MKTVTVSVPGKVHLMGEHTVVYGKPALLAAITLRLFVSVSAVGEDRAADDITVESSESDTYIRHILEVLKKEYAMAHLPPMRITVTSELPSGFHLGSSAATAVAMVGAVTYFLKKVWNPPGVNAIAYEIEKKQHGNPSGGDNTIVTMGGFLWFRKELPFLKSIWQLPMTVPSKCNHFFLMNTGKPHETTGEMVSLVASQMNARKRRYQQLFDENEEQTRRVAASLKEGDEVELMDAMQKGERTLEAMGVVSKKAQTVIREIERFGGAAKILGGGGKTDAVGFLLCFHPERSVVDHVGRLYGYPVQPVQLGGEGIRLEQKIL